MDENQYLAKTSRKPHKSKPRNIPLPTASEKYLEAFDCLKQILDRMEIKYEEYFHFKSTKHWRFDLHLFDYSMLIEIAGGPWSGGRKGKLANKAWSMDRYDHAEDMGYRYVRFEPSEITSSNFAIQWLKNLKASHGTAIPTISPSGSD